MKTEMSFGSEVHEETCITVLCAEPMALYSGPDQRFSYPNGDEVQPFASGRESGKQSVERLENRHGMRLDFLVGFCLTSFGDCYSNRQTHLPVCRYFSRP